MTHYSVRGIGISLVLLALSGCSSVVQTDQGIEVLHTPGDEQFSYIKKHKSLTRICTETNVDDSVTSAGGLTLSAAGESIGDKKSTGDVTMGGRDPTVLITRELMYRSCELALNLNLKAADATQIYMGTLDVLIDIVKVHKGVGTSSVSAPAAKIDILQTKIAATSPASAAAPVPSGTSSDQTKQGGGSSQTNVSSDFSGFSWSDYPNNSNTINSNHP